MQRLPDGVSASALDAVEDGSVGKMFTEMNNYERTLQSGQSLYKGDNAGSTMIQNLKA